MIVQYDKIRIEPVISTTGKRRVTVMQILFMFENKEVKRLEHYACSVSERIHLHDLRGEVEA